MIKAVMEKNEKATPNGVFPSRNATRMMQMISASA